MNNSRWQRFLGGNNLLYTLTVLIMVGILIWIFSLVDFIFNPLILIVSNILLPILIALLLYYLFNPIVDYMEKKGIKRIWGVVILYIAAVLLLVGAGAILIPLLQEQMSSFVETFPTFVESIFNQVMELINRITGSSYLDQVITSLESSFSSLLENTLGVVLNNMSNVSNVISSVTSVVIAVFMAPILLFFILKDDEKFFNGVLKVVPPMWRNDLVKLGVKINLQVGAYIKGTLLVAIINGLLMYVGFKLIGLNYAGIIAIAGGFLSIVPYIGPTLTFIPAAIVALTQSTMTLLLLGAVWLVVQFIEGNLVEPIVKGKSVEVHPMTIIIVLLVMGDLLGVFGLVFGIPIYVIIKVIVVHFFQKIKERYNNIYGEVAGEYSVEKSELTNFGDDNFTSAREQSIEKAKSK